MKALLLAVTSGQAGLIFTLCIKTKEKEETNVLTTKLHINLNYENGEINIAT
ncbi:MAG: hypothetical protein IPP49_20940 [Saprospiraceae bacterium]|nr:hypothetical protein [Saprospiraceae bacterium]